MPAIGFLNAMAIAMVALYVVPQFTELFSAFGGELPNITHLVVDTHRWWGLLAFAVPAVWASWPNPRTRGVTSLVVGTVIALLLLALCLWGCYAPVLALAAVAP
jgi:hypothetical protein